MSAVMVCDRDESMSVIALTIQNQGAQWLPETAESIGLHGPCINLLHPLHKELPCALYH